MNVVLRDPADLHIHPALKGHARWADDDSRLHALTASVREHGVRDPIKITGGHAIVDGRHRWLAAKRGQLATVPCVVVADSEVHTIILDSLLNRRHYTPGQRAYLAVQFLEDAVRESVSRRLANLKSGPNGGIGKPVQTLEQFAASLGISPRLLDLARQLWKLFAGHPEKRTLTDQEGVTEKDVSFREFFEPRLLREEKPYGIGAILAGIGFLLDAEKKAALGKPHTGGKPTTVDRQLQLFNQTIDQELARWDYWQRFSQEERLAHFSVIKARANSLPAEQCVELADYHAALATTFKKAAKANGAEGLL